MCARWRVQVNDEVFKKSFIPRSLFDVVDAERDAQKVAAGDTSDVRARPPVPYRVATTVT